MQEFNFVTDGSVVYRLGGNDWYAVMEDEDKVMLVDTDCKVDDEELKSPWSDGNCRSEDGENGQAVLDYTNNIADKYFNDIKHAIIPTTVEAGTCKLANAYMWSMSYEEFDGNKTIGGKIVENTNSFVWTRTFSRVGSSNDGRYAWRAYSISGDLSYSGNISSVYRVAPAFNLKKSSIDHITEDGEIVLKPEDNVN